MVSENNMEQKKIMIEADELSMVYPGGIKALDKISFSVEEGEIFGFLGPNGAGKSTAIMILTTLLQPTGGKAYVNGFEVTKSRLQARMNIGYVSQGLSVDDILSGEENLILQAGFYNIPTKERRARIDEVLNLVSLNERRKDLVETYSGGMRKRLDIAAGLVHRPRILFLDEPTLGLDTQTRREIWHYITDLRDRERMTIFVTTHYMEEADRICDRIGIIDQGRILALDTPEELKKTLGGDIITFSFPDDVNLDDARKAFDILCEKKIISNINPVGIENNTFAAVTADGEVALPLFFSTLDKAGLKVNKVTLKSPTLDDVFVSFTGSELREEHSNKEKNEAVASGMRRLRK